MVMKKRSRVMRTTATYGILIIALLWTIFPIYWMIKSSLTLNEEMYVARPPLFSNVITFDHYIDLIYNTSFMQFYLLKMQKTWKEPANQDLFHVFSTYNVFANHALRYFLSTALTAPGPAASSLNISSTVSPIPAS